MTQRIKAYVFNTKETKYLSCPFMLVAARMLAQKPTLPLKLCAGPIQQQSV